MREHVDYKEIIFLNKSLIDKFRNSYRNLFYHEEEIELSSYKSCILLI